MSAPPDDHRPVPSLDVDGDDDDMTSIMSPDQRKALQHAAAKEAEALERDTARPPASGTAAETGGVPAIPKAPGLPTMAGASLLDEPAPASRVRRSEPGRPPTALDPPTTSRVTPRARAAAAKSASAASAPSAGGARSAGMMATYVAFALLALAVLAALRT